MRFEINLDFVHPIRDKHAYVDMKFLKFMKCLVCGKKKEDFEVWSNKIVIAATYDSDLQNHENIRKMNADSVICHDCMQSIINQVNESRK